MTVARNAECADRTDGFEIVVVTWLVSREVTCYRVYKDLTLVEHCQNEVGWIIFIAVFPHIDIHCVCSWLNICIFAIEYVLIVNKYIFSYLKFILTLASVMVFIRSTAQSTT